MEEKNIKHFIRLAIRNNQFVLLNLLAEQPILQTMHVKKKSIPAYTVLFLLLTLAVIACRRSEFYSISEEIPKKTQEIPHLEKHGSATQLVIEEKPFLMLSGELHNSSAGGFKYMRPIWKNMAKKNLNTVIASVSWELVEPEEGKFNFELVDSIVIGARRENLKLVLIWFASWKNGGSTYIPSWLKKDSEKYPRVQDENGKPLEIISTYGPASADADAKAFAMLMRHIREIDSESQTVILMQVENEMGILDNLKTSPGDARRDFSKAANHAYNGQVPKKFIDYLVENRRNLFPELHKVWSLNGLKTSGSWEEIFGKSEFRGEMSDWKFYSYYTEELFMAWSYASYVEKVAAAGKKEYPLPMYVNAWLKQPFSFWPGSYPSGGPLPQVIDVWRAAAPSIDFIAPDIYTDEFLWICQEYTRSGNPLFIPETKGGEVAAARAFYAFGEFNAMCFAPFGIDNPKYAQDDPLDESYRILKQLSPLILQNQGNGSMKGILVDSIKPIQGFKLGNYFLEAQLSGDPKPGIAGGLVIQMNKDEYICVGKSMDIFFSDSDTTTHIAINIVDEGHFENGTWIPERRLNGDEVHTSTWSGTGLRFPTEKISIQRVSLYQYK